MTAGSSPSPISTLPDRWSPCTSRSARPSSLTSGRSRSRRPAELGPRSTSPSPQACRSATAHRCVRRSRKAGRTSVLTASWNARAAWSTGCQTPAVRSSSPTGEPATYGTADQPSTTSRPSADGTGAGSRNPRGFTRAHSSASHDVSSSSLPGFRTSPPAKMLVPCPPAIGRVGPSTPNARSTSAGTDSPVTVSRGRAGRAAPRARGSCRSRRRTTARPRPRAGRPGSG